MKNGNTKKVQQAPGTIRLIDLIGIKPKISTNDCTFRGSAKIFGIGLSKTGNTSLIECMRILGSKMIKFPTSVSEIYSFDGATDTSVAATFDVLDVLFPRSRFILTVRHLDAWIESCERMWRRREAFFNSNEDIRRVHQSIYGTLHFDRAVFERAYRQHESRVSNYFLHNKNSLLVIDLIDGIHRWEKLSDFLDKKTPDLPFPQENVTARLEILIAHIAFNSNSAFEASQITGVSGEALRQIAAKWHRSSEETRLEVDRGWETQDILTRAAKFYGSLDRACLELNLVLKI